MAETDKIDGYLKLIQPLYEAVRKFQPDALLLYCVSPSVENPCFYRLHVGLIREGITFVLHQSYKDKKCYFEVETSMFSEAKGSILHRLKEENPEPNRIGNATSLKSFSRSAVNLAIRLVRCPEKATVFSLVTGVPFSVHVLVSISVNFRVLKE